MTSWQDIVIAIANIAFTYSLIMQVAYGFKKKKGLLTIQATLPTFLGLYAMSITFLTLSLFISSGIAFANATLWLILFIQRIIYPKA